MEKIVVELCEIFEVDELPLNVRFEDLPGWDSLSALGVIALLESNYGLHMMAVDLIKFSSVSEFVQYVLAHKK